MAGDSDPSGQVGETFLSLAEEVCRHHCGLSEWHWSSLTSHWWLVLLLLLGGLLLPVPVDDNPALASICNQEGKHGGQEHTVMLPVPPIPNKISSFYKKMFACAFLCIDPKLIHMIFDCKPKIWLSLSKDFSASILSAEWRRVVMLRPKLTHWAKFYLPEGIYYRNLASLLPWNRSCPAGFATTVLWEHLNQLVFSRTKYQPMLDSILSSVLLLFPSGFCLKLWKSVELPFRVFHVWISMGKANKWWK